MKKTILYNIIIISLLVISLEIVLRLFLNIVPQGVSPGIIDTREPYHIFNYSNITKGKVFGSKIFTDKEGFRISKNEVRNNNYENIYFIGGSVTFGNGIDQSKTFSGLLDKQFKKTNILNGGVIGSDIKNNYLTLIKKVKKDNLKKVFISISLDDLDRAMLELGSKNKIERDSNIIEKFKKNSIFRYLNNFIRSKSVIYVWIKGKILDAEQGYYNYSLQAFKDDKNIKFLDKYLNLINKYNLENKNKITFILLPYSKQIDGNGCTKEDLAQKTIKNYLKKHNFIFLDIKELFCKNSSSKKIFLKHDPAHLSVFGHRILANYLQDYIN